MPMCFQFYKASGYSDFVSFDDEKMRAFLADLIDNHIVVIDEGGMAGATLTNTYFSSDPIIHELFWWIEPEYRGNGLGTQIREAMEEFGRVNNAKAVVMSLLDMSTPEHIRNHYRAVGYVPAETGYIRRL